MAKVDPFIHPLPPKIQNDPELRPYFEYWVRWSHDMWKRTGGGDDLIANTSVRESYPWEQDDSGEEIKQDSVSNYTYLEMPAVMLVKKVLNRESYTCSDNMFILMKNNSTLTFPKNPIKNSVIWFFKQDSSLATINGNGKKINGISGNITFRKSRIGRQIHYFDEIGEWVFI